LSKPTCCLSVDLDNQWSYMKTHGDPGWESFPSYLDLVVPRILDTLDRHDWTITFFIVGQDAALEKNRAAIAAIADAGHEIGNHSFQHEPWLHRFTQQQTTDEIARAEDAIENASGQRCRGFRGPGYSLSNTVIQVLAERDYLYDASTLPTFLGPLARAYYFTTSTLNEDQKDERKVIFGTLRDGFQPIRPYVWQTGGRRIIEIPVTTMPLIKLPFHFSYLLYIATYSVGLALMYFKTALALCRLSRVMPSLLLHPLDFLGGDDVANLDFFPAMRLPKEEKLRVLGRILSILDDQYLPRALHPVAENLSESLGD